VALDVPGLIPILRFTRLYSRLCSAGLSHSGLSRKRILSHFWPIARSGRLRGYLNETYFEGYQNRLDRLRHRGLTSAPIRAAWRRKTHGFVAALMPRPARFRTGLTYTALANRIEVKGGSAA
jgi:hypothetical protein